MRRPARRAGRVRHQRRLLRAAGTAEVAEAEVAEAEVETALDAARGRRCGPAELSRAQREPGGVPARVIWSRGLGVDVRPDPVDERRHDLVGQARKALVVAPRLEEQRRRAKAEGVVDDGRPPDASAGVEREPAPRQAEAPEAPPRLGLVAGGVSGFESRTGFQHDDAHARLGEQRRYRRAACAGSHHDGVSRELHAASVPRGGCGGSRGIPPAPHLQDNRVWFATSLMPSRRRSRP